MDEKAICARVNQHSAGTLLSRQVAQLPTSSQGMLPKSNSLTSKLSGPLLKLPGAAKLALKMM